MADTLTRPEEPPRAMRRLDLARMKANASRVRPWHARAAYQADHLAVCSCWMCGNPRRTKGLLTVQELRAEEAFG